MRGFPILAACGLLLAAAIVPCAAAEGDLVLADFEGADYGDWKAEGEAFGPGPARGTLPNQMEVSGYEGQGLVNSYFHGDGTVGRLTSPEFTIQRRYINFLVGGGGWENKTCIQLAIGGHVVRSATGPNQQAGGSEALDWQSWDVGEFAGKKAVIQIVDDATGGWGHINVDQILQSDRKTSLTTLGRDFTVNAAYLHLPVTNGAPRRLMRFLVDGKMVRQFEIELAEGEPDFWTYTEVSDFRGKTLRVEADRLRDGSTALDALRLADAWPQADTMYRETWRPQFHFTPARGWTNDPNGLVFYAGEYHFFFQHNPFGTKWGNMTWGHAVSPDLLHWKQLPDAIHQDALGTIFSGSAVVDEANTAGWQKGNEKVLVCIYTAAGGTNAESKGQPFTQAIAYSNDRGRTWTKFDGNPVLGHVAGENRDPKVFWHAPSKQWIMALYLDGPRYALFASPNLKQWTRLGDIPEVDGTECPDLYELAVDGDPANTRWVFWAANGNYLIGRFDGKSFVKESGPHPSRFGANDYAAQTYSGIPAADGRRIQVAWMNGGQYPDMPFNQQMTVPRVHTLRTTPEGIRLFMEPIDELRTLRGRERAWTDLPMPEKAQPLEGVKGDLFDIEATLQPGPAGTVALQVRGARIEYNAAERRLTALGHAAPVDLEDGRLRLRIVVDRTSVEVFAQGGRVQLATCFLPDAAQQTISVESAEGKGRAVDLHVWEMKSVWP